MIEIGETGLKEMNYDLNLIYQESEDLFEHEYKKWEQEQIREVEEHSKEYE